MKGLNKGPQRAPSEPSATTFNAGSQIKYKGAPARPAQQLSFWHHLRGLWTSVNLKTFVITKGLKKKNN